MKKYKPDFGEVIQFIIAIGLLLGMLYLILMS